MSLFSTSHILFLALASLMINTGCMNKPNGLVTDELNSTSSTPAAFKFDGATSATNLSDTQIQLQWTKLSDSQLVTYRIFMLNAD